MREARRSRPHTGARVGSRRAAAQDRGDPLRDAAARGRLAARARRGERRRAVRAQIPRRRPGAEGARRGGGRRRARAGARASRCPSSRSSSSTPRSARAEPDREIQDLLAASAGLNLGVDFLPGALPFNPAAGPRPAPELAASIVWLDALVTNVDRTARNTNMLLWHGRLWLIDHGASLYFHHAGAREEGHERTPFPLIAEHVLLPFAGSVEEADARLAPRVTRALLEEIAAAVPSEWLAGR